MFSTMGYARVVSPIQFECIVCRLTKDTVAELHRHQTFLHTTEELSLAAIGLRSTLINNAINARDKNCSWLYNPLTHSEFYFMSAKLLADEHNLARFERSVPLDCIVQGKDSNTEELCVPKAGVLKTLEDKNSRRREQYRRSRIQALNSGVLDLSLPKSGQKSKSKRSNSESLNKKKSSKKISKKRLIDEIYGENEQAITDMPQEHLLDEVSERELKTIKWEESFHINENNGDAEETREYGTRAVDEFADLGSVSIPLHMSDFPPTPEADYTKEPEEKRKSSPKKKRLLRRVGKKSSKKAKKSASKNKKKKKHEKLEVDGNFDDHTCLDISEIRGENDETTETFYKQVEIPDIDEGYFNNELYTDPSNHHVDKQSDDFQGVTFFPAYPEDMDDHSILVLDPESRGLIWTSLELVDSSRSPDGEKCSENMQNYIQPEKNETIPQNDENNVVFDCLTLKNPRQERAMLRNEETSTDTLALQRSKRRRMCPDRYIP